MAKARRGAVAEGIETLERALELQRAHPGGLGWVERILFALARELFATDESRALAFAHEAEVGLRELLPGSREADAVSRWLADHEPSRATER